MALSQCWMWICITDCTLLMHFLLPQEYAKTQDQLTHFLTYADNNAVGYFAKQGFTKEITLEQEWVSAPGSSTYHPAPPCQCYQLRGCDH